MTLTTEPVAVEELHPLERQCEWTSETMAGGYVWTLSDDELDELDEALRHARTAVGEDTLAITRDAFPLPTLSARLTEVADDLVNGRGVALLRGLDRGRYSAEDASAIYFGVGLHLGNPWPQNAKGHLLGDVTDQGKRPDDPTSRGNELGGVGLPFHSDGSDLVGLFCLDAGAEGGRSQVANAVTIHNRLVEETPELAAELYGAFAYDARGEQGPGSKAWYVMPAFSRWGDRLFVRYIRPYILAARRHADAPQPSAAAVEAMNRLDAMCADPTYHVSMRLEPGDMQFVNNYHVLHGREPYQDDRAGGRVRHLKRLWLETFVLEPEQKPQPFRLGSTTRSWWAAAGRPAPTN